ncbi:MULTISPECIES: phosphoribosylglycinamide formyltransferase [unclassified Bartonella]|uniref:phosphoribosylglycinamide formyltransferase n=1 Tax=unclassified Bartonella TaxID=2645622 RepID=UPI00099A8A84|nr:MULTISPECIES: phosphoribosylglycinamide formyltransferase [unclassified Bartonella]AQX18407.1 formyltetrahydrofolate-dependent phosphoribosylglycinamide formyltransferase [Bartonella sp. A1379B]AQX22920.1 phosphoribosylglycinamide formyltransferase-1 [Bartonella sp. 11B]AQX23785.1 phosphoribosylglycinamide formyltransferase-1 [Bartonella sp. 114]AQX25373.1 formyltetrahydrofolate-dependent phosphoribosylglycinamide formyltransferase [Bartonella sp. Coyote22sub2]
MKKQIIVFISGNGSNMVSLIKASQQTEYPAKIVAVICNNPQAAGIKKAHDNNIPIHVVDRKNYSTKKTHEEAILTILSQYQPDLICFAGYMQLVSSYFIKLYKERILNIHPSLLPLFKGLNTHEKALAAGVKITGCTVHLVTEEMDAGKILAQAAVPIHPNDTIESLAERVLKAEHKLYPEALKAFIQGNNKTTDYQQQLFSF